MRLLSKIALYIVSLAVLALYLPELYDRLVFPRMEKTHLFYSPVNKRFIFTEKTVGYDAQAASKAEDHHADVAYKDQHGEYYDRLEFERHVPFIYYRNMERRGYLPLVIDGVTLDAATISRERQVLEFGTARLYEPVQDLWPLFEAEPDQFNLIFPDDRCRFTADGLEVVNADINSVDPVLTKLFDSALREAGFAFPARAVAGTFTILKPFDNGVFITDRDGALFQLKRVKGEPVTVKVPLPDGVIPRLVVMSESEGYHGLILDTRDRLHLLLRDGYRLVTLELPHYDPERMDFKIIFDPLYRTAVYSDQSVIRAVAMDTAYAPVAEFSHNMAIGVRTWKHELRDVLFPFRARLQSPYSRMIEPAITVGGGGSGLIFLAPLLGLALFVPFVFIKRLPLKEPRAWALAALFAVTGIYGFITAMFIED